MSRREARILSVVRAMRGRGRASFGGGRVTLVPAAAEAAATAIELLAVRRVVMVVTAVVRG